MVNNLLKIELERYTDDKVFEELAYDVIREVYPSAERAGGTHDLGIDAEETIHLKDKTIERKYQFSIEKDYKGKIRKTINRYNDESVLWDELVYVTNLPVDAGNIKTWFQQTYKKKLIICDQQTIDNILTTNSALWKKHFPTIPMPIDVTENRLENRQLHENMLKCALLYASDEHEEIKISRKDYFEQFILSIALTDKNITFLKVSEVFKGLFHKTLDADLFEEVTSGLVSKDFLLPSETVDKSWHLSDHALKVVNASENTKNDEIKDLVEDVYVEVKGQLPENRKISNDEKERVKNNTKSVLNKFFQLYGADFAINADQKIFTEFRKQEILKEIAGNRLDAYLTDAIIYGIGKILEKPSKKQSHTLSLLSKTFICAQIMQVDPLLSDCKADVLREKTFILDTDVVLHCIVPESPLHESYQLMITNLVRHGCKVCIPESVIEEVIIHAESARGNYKRFKASYSTNDKSTLKEDYRNVFVDGFLVKNAQDPYVDFDNYISNYYDRDEPRKIILDDFDDILPKGVIIGNDDIWTNNISIPEEEIESLLDRLYVKTLDTPKAEYRTDEGNEVIARNDAIIYLTAYHMSNDTERNGMLAHQCYVITTSTRTIRCAKNLNMFKSVVTKPLIVISILSKLGMYDKGYDVVDLLGNPFLARIAYDNWDELENLAKLGVDLRGKRIPRLLLDLKKLSHKELTSEVDAEISDGKTNEILTPPRDEMQDFIDIANEVEKAGYKMMPVPQQIIKLYRAEIEKSKQKDIEISELKYKQKKKERNKQRYSERYSERKK